MDAAKAAWIMKRREIAQRVEKFDHTLVDAHGGFEFISSMNDAVTDCFNRTQVRIRAQPFDHFYRRRFVVMRSGLSLLRRPAEDFELVRGLATDPIDEA